MEQDKEIPADYDKVLLYKRVFGTEDGQKVLADLKRQAYYSEPLMGDMLNLSDNQIRSLHVFRSLINYIEYVAMRDERQKPEENLDTGIINEY